ncbi:hypothetical protein TNCV_590531 [Trichonephila clavipes]|nr:hypothetical protein TNCV_590531 [Trichonephila clavipes]
MRYLSFADSTHPTTHALASSKHRNVLRPHSIGSRSVPAKAEGGVSSRASSLYLFHPFLHQHPWMLSVSSLFSSSSVYINRVSVGRMRRRNFFRPS